MFCLYIVAYKLTTVIYEEMKNFTVHIAFSEDDYEFLQKKAKERELPVSTFIRSYLLTTLRPRTEPPIPKIINEKLLK